MLCAALVVVYAADTPKVGDIQRRGPYEGMVYIPGGTFNLTSSTQGISMGDFTQNSRQVTITPFYMDATPITNAQYREFVHWVRDSILIKSNGLTSFLTEPNANGEQFIDWDLVRRRSPWSDRYRDDPAIQSAIQQMFYPDNPNFYMKREYITTLFNYEYAWYDLQAAVAARNDNTQTREDFIRREQVNIYPDTTVWMADFTYSQNEPMVQGYFSHASYDDYPVVGVSWEQARAYNNWRTRKFENSSNHILPFDLPSEAEWQYAANGNQGDLPYPWGGPTARNGGGILMANFKSGRGDYIEDGYAYTSRVRSFYSNDFGLFDMAGNVSEWTSSTFHESASVFVHDLNPVYRYNSDSNDPAMMKRKVIKGGSWKDTQDYLRNDKSSYEFQDSARSYIGFRSISRALGAN